MTAYHLTGNYAPVPHETTETALAVTGALPRDLTGTYIRNGPNPRSGTSGHWFLGDGMLHGVRFEDGRATWYRNRWVDTDRSGVHRPDGTRNLRSAAANTHVVRHAGRMLALVESSFPYEITPDLGTVGPYDFAGRLDTPMTAHPKADPVTGELHFFGYSPLPPFLTYHRADAAGNLVYSREIEVPRSTMTHDFQLTERHVLFFDLPVVFDMALVDQGTMPYRWDPSCGARIGVLRRDAPDTPVRWFEIDPCYVFHTFAAHDAADTVVLTAMRFADLSDRTGATNTAVAWRWTVDLAAGTVRSEQLDDRDAEFPRIDDRLAGRGARFGHAVGKDTLIRYDLETGDAAVHAYGPGRRPDEMAFVPSTADAGGPGLLMGYVYDAASDTSDLVVHDAGTLERVAAVHLPVRVPFGFHGDWFADPA
ncbi:MAG: 9-cis-epoxycarotenoid dioxygenase [Streptomycetaceae bacterium]|nr:9-cis-epoxycarotenoid dioxygenase [Streptomycetaceae bacterium]